MPIFRTAISKVTIDDKVSELTLLANCIDCLAQGIDADGARDFPGAYGDAVYYMGRQVFRLANEIHDLYCADKRPAGAPKLETEAA